MTRLGVAALCAVVAAGCNGPAGPSPFIRSPTPAPVASPNPVADIRVTGRVVDDASRPVPGASIAPGYWSGAYVGNSPALSSADGTFEFRVAGWSRGLDVTVAKPGFENSQLALGSLGFSHVELLGVGDVRPIRSGSVAIHRLFHTVPFLWRFHAIHHSSVHLDWIAGSRLHLVDVVITRGFTLIPIVLLGFSQPAVYAYVVFVSFHAVFIHANVRWRWPRLRWLVATPEFHHWHHTSDEEGLDKNFAAFLPALDRLFGTAHLPDHWPQRYGTVKFQPPEDYLGQLLYPFRRRRDSTPYG